MLPPAARWGAFGRRLTELSSQGDVEAQNALAILQEQVDVLAADPAQGAESLDAMQGWLAAVDTFADRCRAVGSSALQ